jgi:hypothetical protein
MNVGSKKSQKMFSDSHALPVLNIQPTWTSKSNSTKAEGFCQTLLIETQDKETLSTTIINKQVSHLRVTTPK